MKIIELQRLKMKITVFVFELGLGDRIIIVKSIYSWYFHSVSARCSIYLGKLYFPIFSTWPKIVNKIITTVSKGKLLGKSPWQQSDWNPGNSVKTIFCNAQQQWGGAVPRDYLVIFSKHKRIFISDCLDPCGANGQSNIWLTDSSFKKYNV